MGMRSIKRSASIYGLGRLWAHSVSRDLESVMNGALMPFDRALLPFYSPY